ncbi:MAG TPA: hypothetical protein PLR99_21665 [Polyangiaceae bacterium]|nr:hypothetical protein [Polyangiaceae bacterium]
MSDPLDALRAYHARLEADLAELEVRRAEQPGLAAAAGQVARELRETQALLDGHARHRRLPMLEAAKIASPCPARWEDMVGDEHTRFCAGCQKTVFNLSALTADEAEALLLAHGAGLCARLYRRPDGTVLTRDCPVGVRRKRLRGVRALGLAAAFGAAITAVADDDRACPAAVFAVPVPPVVRPERKPTPPTNPAEALPFPFENFLLGGIVSSEVDPKLPRDGVVPPADLGAPAKARAAPPAKPKRQR